MIHLAYLTSLHTPPKRNCLCLSILRLFFASSHSSRATVNRNMLLNKTGSSMTVSNNHCCWTLTQIWIQLFCFLCIHLVWGIPGIFVFFDERVVSLLPTLLAPFQNGCFGSCSSTVLLSTLDRIFPKERLFQHVSTTSILIYPHFMLYFEGKKTRIAHWSSNMFEPDSRSYSKSLIQVGSSKRSQYMNQTGPNMTRGSLKYRMALIFKLSTLTSSTPATGLAGSFLHNAAAGSFTKWIQCKGNALKPWFWNQNGDLLSLESLETADWLVYFFWINTSLGGKGAECGSCSTADFCPSSKTSWNWTRIARWLIDVNLYGNRILMFPAWRRSESKPIKSG